MGLENTALTWVNSYLSGRKQSCLVDGHLSAPADIPQCGVPQGSIGGPILWLIFTCDQPDIIHSHAIDIEAIDRGCSSSISVTKESKGQTNESCGLLVGYVDDGAYSYASESPAVLSSVLTKMYQKIENWMNANRLVINPDKTHLLVIGSRRHSTLRNSVSMSAGGFVVKPSEFEKLLGGMLHQNLTWNLHIRDHKGSLLSQLNSRINGLRKLSINANFQTRLMVANGVVMSKLTYLITLWGNANEYLLDALQVQQLAAARAVCGFGCARWSKRQILKKVGWLSVRQLVFYHTVIQVHKTLHSGVPKALYQSLSISFPRVLRCSTSGQLRQDSSLRSKKTFKYRAIQSYNMVPADIRTGSTVTVKYKLKKWVSENVSLD